VALKWQNLAQKRVEKTPENIFTIGRIFSNFLATLAGKVRNYLATVVVSTQGENGS
jgi:hypothetical protein